jgi:tripartite-type tricarboxylate transporter receptor subunit TctC
MPGRIVRGVLLAVMALIAASPRAAAEDYPDHVVRIVNPYPPGGSVDVMARLLAQKLGEQLGAQFIVETRAGAGGNTGADSVAKSEPDGYTLLFTAPGPLVVNPTLYGSGLGFDPAKDFAPIALFATTPLVLMLNNGVPAKNVQELIALAKKEPGRLTFASSGVGNSDHLCGELFNLQAGIQAIHVPYKGGAPAVQDVVPGRVSYYFAGMPVGLPLAKSGRARALGVTSKERFPGAPDIPTIAEQGLPNYEATLWQGFFAPASIDPALGARIARDVEAVLRLPDTRVKLDRAGVTLFEDNQENFKKFFHGEIEKWKDVVKRTNLKLE